MVVDKIRKAFLGGGSDFGDEEYLEIDLGREEKENKVLVKLFVLKNYDDDTRKKTCDFKRKKD